MSTLPTPVMGLQQQLNKITETGAQKLFLWLNGYTMMSLVTKMSGIAW
jgi:hypothetical protein